MLSQAHRSPAALSALAAIICAPTVAPAQETGERLGERLEEPPLVERVVVRGADAFDEGEVAAAASVRPTRCRSVLFQPFCWFTEGAFFQERHRLDREELPRDELRIRVFYWLRGYRDARATSDVEPAGDGVEVRFEVVEGPPTRVRSVDVVQDTAVLSRQVVAQARLPPVGEPLDMLRLRAARERLRGLLLDRGYANAVVRDSVAVRTGGGEGEGLDAGDEAPRIADVRMRVSPGRPVTIEGIAVRGNHDVSERTILRSLGLRVGQLYRRRDLEEAQRRLYRSNLFRQSFVATFEESPALAASSAPGGPARPDTAILSGIASDSVEVDPGDSTRVVLVVVREAPFDEVGLGTGISTVQFAQAEARYTRYNFLDGGRRMELRASAGNLFAPWLYDRPLFDGAVPRGVGRQVEDAFLEPTWSVSADFTQPWLRSAENSLTARLFGRRRAVIGVVVDRGYGGSATFTRTVSRGVPVSLSYRFERTEVDAGGIYFCVNFGICGDRTIDALQRPQRLSPVSLTARAERVDDPMNPHRGFTAELDAQHASAFTASDYRYSRIAGEAAFYRRLGSGVLALRARAGWVHAMEGTAEALGVERGETALLHPRKRLYSGGSRSVRGYGENQLGPRVLTVAAERLTEADGGEGLDAGCTLRSIRARACDPNGLPSDAFEPRPLGGNRVVEGTVEYRFPLGSELGGAVFVDAGYVGDLDLNIPTGAKGAVTPGFGLRYQSPVGVIRLDLGVRPGLVERLPVVTAVGEPGARELVALRTPKRFDPVASSDGFLAGIYRRLVLHLSIGEAF